MATWNLIGGTALEALAGLPAESVHCVVTSPPYLWKRIYEDARGEPLPAECWPEISYSPMHGLPPVVVSAQEVALGCESDPLHFVGHLVAIFREVRRVLRKDGTCWVNLADSYQTSCGFHCGHERAPAGWNLSKEAQKARRLVRRGSGLPMKNLMGIPSRVAFALQADGWIWRQRVIWEKPCPVPETVKDRPHTSAEDLLLFVKSRRYYYDADAVTEPLAAKTEITYGAGRKSRGGGHLVAADNLSRDVPDRGPRIVDGRVMGARLRSVWRVASQPRLEDHFAAFPDEIPLRCIQLGCPPGGTVLDPFAGRGTTGVVALRADRNAILIERSALYREMIERNIEGDAPLLHACEHHGRAS